MQSIENFYLENSFIFFNAFLMGAFAMGWMQWCLRHKQRILLTASSLIFSTHLFLTALYGPLRSDESVLWRALSVAVAPLVGGGLYYLFSNYMQGRK